MLLEGWGWTLFTDCIHAGGRDPGRDIQEMNDGARAIKYETFRAIVGGRNVDALASKLQYDVGKERGGLRLRNDHMVEYARSAYRGYSCVLLRHSRVEYIFVRTTDVAELSAGLVQDNSLVL